jgi:arachidonate 15-lipoxygenase
MSAFLPAFDPDRGATEADYVAHLPPRDQAVLQMNIGYMLGVTHYARLGGYEKGYLREPRLEELAGRFSARLGETERIIAERNQHRRPYPFLLPSGVPQSINI